MRPPRQRQRLSRGSCARATSRCYVALVGDDKPYLLTATRNNLGAETRITYATSTRFLLEDRLQGSHWVTRLPFPVNVVERRRDAGPRQRPSLRDALCLSSRLFRRVAREFRGFGYVEQWDTEEEALTTRARQRTSSPPLVPPVLTRRWYHIGLPTADGDMGRALCARLLWRAGNGHRSDLERSASRTLLSSAVLPRHCDTGLA
ncbi:hypothetical protein F2981_32810 (plasmid) [Sinorhizobium meliloti]|nr:hypothetical protein [Sinorhizobium meliloti]